MEDSILKSTKKLLGLSEDYTAFDLDILMFINSAFSSLNTLGVKNDTIINVNGSEETWDELELSEGALPLAKIYIYLKVRMLFDPPATSFLIESVEKIIGEHEWKLQAFYDDTTETAYPEEVEEVV